MGACCSSNHSGPDASRASFDVPDLGIGKDNVALIVHPKLGKVATKPSDVLLGVGDTAKGYPYLHTEYGPPLPPCEEDRLATVRALGLTGHLRPPPDPEVESILKLVTSIFNAPAALVALFDDRTIFITETAGAGFCRGDFPWRNSFCAWTMGSQADQVMVIPDATKDKRFAHSPYVMPDGGVRFYCGAPLLASNGHRLGTLCFADTKPRTFDAGQAVVLGNLSEMVVRQLEKDLMLQLQRADNSQLVQAYSQLKRAVDCLDHCVALVDTSQPAWRLLYINTAWGKLTGASREAALGKALEDVFEPAPPRSGLTLSISQTKSSMRASEEYGAEGLLTDVRRKSVAAGKEVVIRGVKLRSSYSSRSCSVNTDSGSCSAATPSAARRLILRLRPATDPGLDDAALPVAVPSYVPTTPEGAAAGCPTPAKYYFMTIQDQDAQEACERSPLSSMLGTFRYSAAEADIHPGLRIGVILGRGGYGTVHRGVYYGTPVAVKLIEQAGGAPIAASIETLMGQELRHPNIVATLKVVSQLPGATPGSTSTMATMDLLAGGHTGTFSVEVARGQLLAQDTPAPTTDGAGAATKPGANVQAQAGTAGALFLPHLDSSAAQQPPAKSAMKLFDFSSRTRLDAGAHPPAGPAWPVIRTATKGHACDDSALQDAKLEHSSEDEGADGGSTCGTAAQTAVPGGAASQIAALGAANAAVGRLDANPAGANSSPTTACQARGDAPKAHSGMLGPATCNSEIAVTLNTNLAVPPCGDGAEARVGARAGPYAGVGFSGCVDSMSHGGACAGMFDLGAGHSMVSTQQGAAGSTAGMAIARTWIIMEFCDRGSLQDAVDRGWLCTLGVSGAPNMAAPHMPSVLATAYEVASALHYLHSQGIIHGDLSAWNVLLTSSGAGVGRAGRGFCAKIADFGLARSLDVVTRIQTRTYGTITHMPPETLSDGVVSRETDTYSLGVLLWQMYTGSRPWAGLTHGQIIYTVTQRTAVLRFPPEAPAAYAKLALACLNPNPDDRPTMANVVAAIDEMMDAQGDVV